MLAPSRPSVVAITVMWELSWYRFEIDLSDEAGGVRREGQGDELSELSERGARLRGEERGGHDEESSTHDAPRCTSPATRIPE